MYSYISGKLIERNPSFVVIDVQGVGYLINISLNTYSELEGVEEVKLLTHLIVKEDSHTLYGFKTEKEKMIFQFLISVSGVGPNTARMMLSSLSPNELYQSIVGEQVKRLQSVKGIGGKTAQRIILELKEKLSKEDFDTDGLSLQQIGIKDEALAGLTVLGFNKAVASKVIDKILEKEKDASVEVLIKEALKKL